MPQQDMKIQREFQRNAATLGQHNSEVIAYRYYDYVFFFLIADDEFDYVECYDTSGTDCGYFYADRSDCRDFEDMCADFLHEQGD